MTDEELLSAWDSENPTKSVTELSQRTGTSEQQVQEALVRAALAATEGVATRWWKKEGISLAVGCLILIPLVTAVVSGVHRRATASTVIAKRDLVPYQALTDSDVEVSQSIVTADGLTGASQIRGRYLRKPVSAGKPVLKSDLSGTSAPDLQRRSTVEIPFKTGAVQPTPIPRCVSVLFTSKTSGKENLTAMGIWLLGVRQEKDMDWVAMAVPTTELTKVNAAMSGSDPILAFPATSPGECNFDFIGLPDRTGQSSGTRSQAITRSSKKGKTHKQKGDLR